MMLVPKYITEKLPALYAMEDSKDPMVICKFFMPMTKWTWYAIEFDGEDTFFGYNQTLQRTFVPLKLCFKSR